MSEQIDVNAIADTLNDKADVDLTNGVANASSTAKETIINWFMPDYSNGVSLGVTSYTAPSNGWIKVDFDIYEGVVTLSINNVAVATGGGNASNNDQKIFPISKGDVVTSTKTNGLLTFFPCKGA